jgi:lipid-A-disaccharide synthase
MNQSCLIIAGEKSGEEHALSFLPDLKERVPETHFWGVGGDQLSELGVELLYHLKDFSSWGYSGVIQKIPFYWKALAQIEAEVEKRGTKTAILIDFQDFNMILAKRLKKKGVAVLYYVAPQAWAWKAWRAKRIEQTVHTLFTIIPFEKKWFADRGVHRVQSVSHPVWFHYHQYWNEIQERRPRPTNKKRLLLLPGSREAEIKGLLPEFSSAIEILKENYDLEVSIVRAGHLPESLFGQYGPDVDHVYSHDELATALLNSDLCLAASGTVTLICALFAVPTVVTYKTSLLNAYLFYSFVKYLGPVSLANIVHNKRVFPELIQEQASGFNMAKKLEYWIQHNDKYDSVFHELKRTGELIQGDTNQTAEHMASVISRG